MATRPRPVRGPRLSDAELDELVELLRALIRIPTVNPPGDEIRAARYLEGVLTDAGLKPAVFEPFPGRGSIVCRVRGDGSRGGPLLLLSHLDVVPAPAEGWTHDPFGAELVDGYVWGRGAIDMKAMVAMEVTLMRGFAARARAVGRDPAADPIPGLGRDVIFASTADEEAGGWQGANWLVNEHPDLLEAEAALNEVGAIPMPFAGSRFYPVQVAEKGGIVYRLTVHGRWGHGSMPGRDNAAVLAAEVVTRLAAPAPPRVGKVVAAMLAAALPHLPAEVIGALAAPGRPAVARVAGRGLRPALRRLPRSTVRELVERAMRRPADLDAMVERLCDPALVPAASAVLRSTISVGILQAGLKYNVIPGVATIELDARTLPGVEEAEMTEELRRRIGPELLEHVDIEVVAVGPPVEAPLTGELYPLLERTLRDHDRAAVPIPVMVPWVTDAKHVARIGVPTYGFSPIGVGGDENLLRMLHGDDERVSVEGLRWGLPVLVDAVERFCGAADPRA